MKELVSVVMPTFNVGSVLKESIESILQQTYNNIELLITDDCSTDETTLEILRYYQKKDSRVRVCYQKENKGAGVARNNCIKRATGRYIAFCDSDDRWMADKLEKQILFMKNKQCALSYSSYILCDNNDIERGVVIAPEKITFSMLKRDNKIGCLTAIYDIRRLGAKYYMPSMRKRQDWAMFLAILKKCRIAYGMSEPLAYYRIRGGSLSTNKFSLIKYNARVYQDVLGFSSFKSYLYLTFVFTPSYFAKVVKKKLDSIKYISKKRKNKQKKS